MHVCSLTHTYHATLLKLEVHLHINHSHTHTHTHTHTHLHRLESQIQERAEAWNKIEKLALKNPQVVG